MSFFILLSEGGWGKNREGWYEDRTTPRELENEFMNLAPEHSKANLVHLDYMTWWGRKNSLFCLSILIFSVHLSVFCCNVQEDMKG
jgi:hypothetical protein